MEYSGKVQVQPSLKDDSPAPVCWLLTSGRKYELSMTINDFDNDMGYDDGVPIKFDE